jgi:hypothetical protein
MSHSPVRVWETADHGPGLRGEAVAKLSAKTKSDLIAVAALRCLFAADRVGFDQVEGAEEFVENKLVACRDSLRRRAGMDLQFI